MNINFKYSGIYESRLKGFNYFKKDETLSRKEAFKIIDRFELVWKKEEKRIFNAIEKITGYTFKNKKMDCWLNSRATFSDPLSIRLENIEVMVDNLLHELIHVIYSQNIKTIDKKWLKQQKQIKKIFSKSDFSMAPVCTNHVPIHAAQILITKIVRPKRLQQIVSYVDSFKDYKDAFIMASILGEKKVADDLK